MLNQLTNQPTVDSELARFLDLEWREGTQRSVGHVTAAARERAYRRELRAFRRAARKKP